jgi:single-strand DNA-binding protein
LTEVVANDMQMLDSRGGGSADFGQSQPRDQSAKRANQPQTAPADSGFEDDIPF